MMIRRLFIGGPMNAVTAEVDATIDFYTVARYELEAVECYGRPQREFTDRVDHHYELKEFRWDDGVTVPVFVFDGLTEEEATDLMVEGALHAPDDQKEDSL